MDVPGTSGSKINSSATDLPHPKRSRICVNESNPNFAFRVWQEYLVLISQKHLKIKLKKSRHERLVFHVNPNSKENPRIDAIRAKNTFVYSARNKCALTVLRI